MKLVPNRWAASWARLREPTLVRRSMVSVLCAFVLIWAVLLGYQYYLNKQAVANTPGLQKFGNALLSSLAEIDDPAQARAMLAATAKWVNLRRADDVRFSGIFLFELMDRHDQPVYASPALRAGVLRAAVSHWAALRPDRSIAEAEVNGELHRIYQGRSQRWTLRIAEPKRSDSAFLSYNSLALLPYLALALPFVLLPVWLSVRNGLAPLRGLAGVIARRRSDALGPIGFDARHRELKPLVHALDALLQSSREQLQRERAFVQDAAHELRTPLAVIGAQAHVMAHARDGAGRAQAQAQLEQAIARASHLAQQLLDLASLDEAARPAPLDVDVAQHLRQLLAEAAPLAIARGIEIALEAPDRLWRSADVAALTSIVHNLVGNALRYGRPGGELLVMLASGAGGALTLTVQDDGPGIAVVDRPRLFERFYRGAGHESSGSGLGLAIVRQAAQRLGGGVALMRGLNGQGVGFRVELALAPALSPPD